MSILRLVLTDYRNVASATVDFVPGFTVLAGRNGAGKTNIVEALYLVSTLRSFRVNTLAPLIRHGAGFARIELRTNEPACPLPTKLTVALEQSASSVKRLAAVDDKIQRSAESFYGRVPAVLFTPEDLNVLRGSPSGRRQVLDRALFARTRAHITDVRAYEKLVRSRNRLLKQRRAGEFVDPVLDTYDEQLAAHGAKIWTRRVNLLRELIPQVELAFAEIHGTGRCELRYVARLGDIAEEHRGQALLDLFRARRDVDCLRGTTSAGPHHDDFVVHLDDKSMAEYASQGQTRAAMLAFKIGEMRSARELHGAAPLLLLDDVSSELDRQRSQQLFALLQREVHQCVVTTTAGEYLPFDGGSRRVEFVVESGVVQT